MICGYKTVVVCPPPSENIYPISTAHPSPLLPFPLFFPSPHGTSGGTEEKEGPFVISQELQKNKNFRLSLPLGENARQIARCVDDPDAPKVIILSTRLF